MPFCPNCGSERVLRSNRQTWWRSVQRSLGLRHYLCDDCYHRFTARADQDAEDRARAIVPPPPAEEAITAPSATMVAEAPEPYQIPPDSDPREPEPRETEPGQPSWEPEPQPEPRPAWRDSGPDDLQPRLDFAGPALEDHPPAATPPRPAASGGGLWLKIGLGLGLLMICGALLLWYRHSLSPSSEPTTPEPVDRVHIQDQASAPPPTMAPPAMTPAPARGETTPAPGVWPPAGGGQTVGTIPPPATSEPEPAAPPRPWVETTPSAPVTTPAPTTTQAPPTLPPAATPTPKPQPATAKTARPAARTAPATSAAKPKTATSQGGYTLQFGAFKDQDRAMALAARLKSMGYKVDLVQDGPGGSRALTKVRSGRYASADEARQARAKAARLTAIEVVIIPPARP